MDWRRPPCATKVSVDTFAQSIGRADSVQVLRRFARYTSSEHTMRPAINRLLLCALVFSAAQGAADEPYPFMPEIAPIGERTSKYLDIPESARGPAVDPAKGYRLQDLGYGLFMVTDNIYQSMFRVYDRGVVVVDAPPNYAKRSRRPSRRSRSVAP
jgi:hypothetical protein